MTSNNISQLQNYPQKFISQIIFPLSLLYVDEPGYLVGWNAENFQCIVACVISKSITSVDNLLQSVEAVYDDYNFVLSKYRKQQPSCPPMVLGEWLPRSHSSSGYVPDAKNQQNAIWVVLSQDSCSKDSYFESSRQYLNFLGANHEGASQAIGIKLHSIYSLGCKYHSTSCYMISYETPDTENVCAISSFESQYRSDSSTLNKLLCINAAAELEKYVCYYLQRIATELGDPIAIEKSLQDAKESYTILDRLLLQIVWLLSGPAWPVYVISESLVTFAGSNMTWLVYLTRLSHWKNLAPMNKQRKVSDSKYSESYEKEAPLDGYSATRQGSLREISYLMHECDKKCKNIINLLRYSSCFPLLWNTDIVQRRYLWTKVNAIGFGLLLDIALGIFVGRYFFRNISLEVEHIESFLFNMANYSIYSYLSWFNNAPWGIKLNPMITVKIGNLIRLFINQWGYCLRHLHFLSEPLLEFICCLGGFGFTFQLAILADILRMMTFPLQWLHIVSSHQFRFHIDLLYSLWLLFKGQKLNILQDRVDSCEYEQGQLLFGVMLFAIMFFALPNFAVYYILFVALRLIGISVISALWHSIIFIREFPLYAILLYLFSGSSFVERVFLQLVLVKDEGLVASSTSPKYTLSHVEELIEDIGSPKLDSATSKLSKAPIFFSNSLGSNDNFDAFEDKGILAPPAPSAGSKGSSSPGRGSRDSDKEKVQAQNEDEALEEDCEKESAADKESQAGFDSDSLKMSSKVSSFDDLFDIPPPLSLRPIDRGDRGDRERVAISRAGLVGSASTEGTNVDKRLLSQDKFCSTYISLKRARPRIREYFPEYLAWLDFYVKQQHVGFDIAGRIAQCRPLYMRILHTSLSLESDASSKESQILIQTLDKLFHGLGSYESIVKQHGSSSFDAHLQHLVYKLCSGDSRLSIASKYWDVITVASSRFDYIIKRVPASSAGEPVANKESFDLISKRRGMSAAGVSPERWNHIVGESGRYLNKSQQRFSLRLILFVLFVVCIQLLSSFLGLALFTYTIYSKTLNSSSSGSISSSGSQLNTLEDQTRFRILKNETADTASFQIYSSMSSYLYTLLDITIRDVLFHNK